VIFKVYYKKGFNNHFINVPTLKKVTTVIFFTVAALMKVATLQKVFVITPKSQTFIVTIKNVD